MTYKPMCWFLLLFCLHVSATHAQNAIVSTGNSFTGSGGSISWSVGQVAYTTYKSPTGFVSKGVQQTYLIVPVALRHESILSPIAVTKKSFSLSVFPNPFTENLILQIPSYDNDRVIYQLVDLQGRILKTNVIRSSHTEINTNQLSSSVYFLRIIRAKKQVQSYKIIKN